MRQELIEALVQAVGVDLLRRHAQQIFQGRPPIPGVGNVPLARRLAEPRHGEDRRDRGPGHSLAACFDLPLEQLVEAEHPPQAPGQPHVAEVARPLQPDAAQLDQQRLVVARRGGSNRLRSRPPPLGLAVQVRAESRPAILLLAAQLARLGDDSLPRAFRRAIRLGQRPVRMRPAVLVTHQAAEKRERSLTRG